MSECRWWLPLSVCSLVHSVGPVGPCLTIKGEREGEAGRRKKSGRERKGGGGMPHRPHRPHRLPAGTNRQAAAEASGAERQAASASAVASSAARWLAANLSASAFAPCVMAVAS